MCKHIGAQSSYRLSMDAKVGHRVKLANTASGPLRKVVFKLVNFPLQLDDSQRSFIGLCGLTSEQHPTVIAAVIFHFVSEQSTLILENDFLLET